jgi:hypothetical protein
MWISIRLTSKGENFTWHEEMFGIWKQNIINFKDMLNLPITLLLLTTNLKNDFELIWIKLHRSLIVLMTEHKMTIIFRPLS